eukprot:TRINITY_DN1855_c0_g1_i2.p1 TRINITY_DN1855_c0_g1~~TRINITY_DN1855_c0_g1_i2.p1  ORF type:complete len:104 (-),score=21.16 TRINITY_DN1855_c0_g1_i2:245-556(-)
MIHITYASWKIWKKIIRVSLLPRCSTLKDWKKNANCAQNGGELPQDIPPIIQAVIAKRKRRARKQAHSKKGNQPRRRKGKGRRRKPNGGFPGKPVKIKKKSPA